MGCNNSDYFDSNIKFLEEMCRQGLSTTTLLALSTASWKWNGNTLASQDSQLMIASIQIPSQNQKQSTPWILACRQSSQHKQQWKLRGGGGGGGARKKKKALDTYIAFKIIKPDLASCVLFTCHYKRTQTPTHTHTNSSRSKQRRLCNINLNNYFALAGLYKS